MKLKLVPARQGVLWVRQGLGVFFARPLAFCSLYFLCILFAPFFIVMVGPVTWLGFMIATRRAQNGKLLWPAVFIEPLQTTRSQVIAQLQLCLLYAIGTILLSWLVQQTGADWNGAAHVLFSGQATPEQVEALLGDPKLQAAQLVALVGLAVLSIPFWYAPALIHWGKLSAPKALFFSVVACWRNKGALAAHALVWFAVLAGVSMLASLVLLLVGPESSIVVMPALLMFPAAICASLYFTFADSFEIPDEIPGIAQETP